MLGHELVELLLVARQAHPLRNPLELRPRRFEVVGFGLPIDVEDSLLLARKMAVPRQLVTFPVNLRKLSQKSGATESICRQARSRLLPVGHDTTVEPNG